MLEPNARRRLRLVAATSRDLELVKDLRQALEEDHPMSFMPSADLLRDIAVCAACTQDGPSPRAGRAGLCDAHRSRWNLEACMAESSEAAEDASLDRLVSGVLQSPDGGAQLLSAFDRQRRALRLVLEAHARGVVRLPESIALTVERAATSGPRFLNGGSRAAHTQAAS
jgi:hypothetical protein